LNLEYLPNHGFIINSTKIVWNSKRDSVRKLLDNKHQADDRVINVAEFFDGDKNKNIYQKRDIYKDIYSKNDSLFLSYDQNNLLTELEVHNGFNILVDGISMEFGNEILNVVKQFRDREIECTEIENGNYLLSNLKMTIANGVSLGGDGTFLKYFYGAKDISHLME